MTIGCFIGSYVQNYFVFGSYNFLESLPVAVQSVWGRAINSRALCETGNVSSSYRCSLFRNVASECVHVCCITEILNTVIIQASLHLCQTDISHLHPIISYFWKAYNMYWLLAGYLLLSNMDACNGYKEVFSLKQRQRLLH